VRPEKYQIYSGYEKCSAFVFMANGLRIIPAPVGMWGNLGVLAGFL
jgi:hypothetical protein